MGNVTLQKNLTWQLVGAKNAWLQFLVDTKEPSTDCLIVLLKHALCSSVNCFKFLIQAHCTQMYLFMQVIFTFWKLVKGTLFTSFTFVNNIWIVKYLAEILEFQKETLMYIILALKTVGCSLPFIDHFDLLKQSSHLKY